MIVGSGHKSSFLCVGFFNSAFSNLFAFIMAFGWVYVSRYESEHVRDLDRMHICSDLCKFFRLLYESDFLVEMLNGLGS